MKAGSSFKPIRLGWPVSGVWLLPETSDGPFLVDAGFWTRRRQIVSGIRRHGVSPKELKGIVLTHRHVDHAGNAAWFQKHYGTPVYAHEEDAAILQGSKSQPKLTQPPSIVGALSLIENTFPARFTNAVALKDGDRVAGLEVMWMPGHTMGSIFLYHRDSGTLFTGDGLLNAVPPLVHAAGLSLPYPHFCDDYALSLESLRRFLDMDVDVRLLCSGHGAARRGPVQEALRKLLDDAAPHRNERGIA